MANKNPIKTAAYDFENKRLRYHGGCFGTLNISFKKGDSPCHMMYGKNGEIKIFSDEQVEKWRDAYNQKSHSIERTPKGKLRLIGLFLEELSEVKISFDTAQVVIGIPKAMRSSKHAPEEGSVYKIKANNWLFELWGVDESDEIMGEIAEEVSSMTEEEWIEARNNG